MELCPAIRASVHASQPDSPSRVKNVCLKEYRTNGRTPFFLSLAASFATVTNAALCCFLKLDASTWPLRRRRGQGAFVLNTVPFNNSVNAICCEIFRFSVSLPRQSNRFADHTLVATITLADLRAGEAAVTRIRPGLPVDCTMARHNPLNALRVLDL
jgi:hypothetical protein